MPRSPRSAPRSPYARLLAEPRRFRFDAALRILTRAARSADPAEAARFRTVPGFGYPAAEVTALEPARDGHAPELTTPVIGLTGAAGVLPRLYTEVLTTTLRNRSPALHRFLDMLSHRIVAMFGGAGVKYRLNRAAETAVATDRPEDDRVAEALLAFTGFATPHLVPRLAVGVEPLLHYSGFFSSRPRSAERLTALLSDWLGRKVEVVQFAGAWLPLPPDQCTSLAVGRHPGAWNRLAVDAAIGVRAWDPQARIILRIGPLDYPSFAALLPDHSGLQRLVSMVRAFLGYETGFAVNPVLAGAEVPALRMDRDADPAPRLGWNTWIPAPEPLIPGIPPQDADDAIFEAEIVEAEELAGRARGMTKAAGDWGGGYVTDIAYLPGYYRHQSPLHLNVACLIGGVAGIEIGPATKLTYLELGCGQGFGALMLAACNPAWQVIGIDYNPAHIAAARALCAEAGIANARFIEADLAAIAETPAGRELPEADVVTLHGLWSWVGDAARAGIVRLLADKLRPGGVAYVSYNALPAWQSAIGMQRALLEFGARASGRSDRQVAAGWGLVRAMIDAGAHHLREGALVQSLSEYSQAAPAAYLAHEYMNAAWRPCFHADVVQALAGAKLDWVASAQLLENFTPLMLGDKARAVLSGYDDPVMRELLKDMFLTRCLRQDVFVRGARRLTNAERDAALCEVTLALLTQEDQFAWEFEVPVGQANIERKFFGPIVAALAEAPRRVSTLLGLPGLPRRDNPGEVVGMLVGSHQALPVIGPPSEPDDRVRELNRAAAKRFVCPDNLDVGMALAASGTGSPVPCTMLDLFIAGRLQSGAPLDPAAWAGELGATQPASEQDRLRGFIERVIAERSPAWRRLGGLPSQTAVAL